MVPMRPSLGKPELPPYVEENDLLDLAAEFGAGYHPSATIYGVHAELLAAVDRLPMSRRSFGLALREAGWMPVVKRKDRRMTRCWRITNPWVRRAQARNEDG